MHQLLPSNPIAPSLMCCADFSKVTDEEVREMQDQLNGRPRQTLGWKKPAEAYAELLDEAA